MMLESLRASAESLHKKLIQPVQARTVKAVKTFADFVKSCDESFDLGALTSKVDSLSPNDLKAIFTSLVFSTKGGVTEAQITSEGHEVLVARLLEKLIREVPGFIDRSLVPLLNKGNAN